MAPRYYRPDFVYEVARRTVSGEFLFDINDKSLMEAIVGALALAQRRHNIEIYHFHLMSNHYHGLFNAPSPARLARFLNLFHGLVGSAVNQRLGRQGPVWTRKFKPLAVTPDEPTLMKRMNYLTGQAVRAGVVQHPSEFCGPSAVDWLVAGVPLRGRFHPTLHPIKARAADEPRAPGDLDRAKAPSQLASPEGSLEVKIDVLPCFRGKSWAELHPVFAAQADELAAVPLAALLARGAATKLPSVDLALAGAEDHEPADRAESAEQAEVLNTSDPSGSAEASAPLPEKRAAAEPGDDLTGKRRSRPAPTAATGKARRKEPLVILSVNSEAREAYRACLTDFLAQYERAMRRLAAQLARSAKGLRVRAVKFPPFALLPGCIEASPG